MTQWKVMYACMTDNGVTFQVTMSLKGMTSDDAVLDGMKLLLASGCPVSLQKGSPPVPVMPIAASAIWIEETSLIQGATHIPAAKGLN